MRWLPCQLIRPDPRSVLRARHLGAAALLAVRWWIVVALNLPFALLSWDGWLTPFRFQAARPIDNHDVGAVAGAAGSAHLLGLVPVPLRRGKP